MITLSYNETTQDITPLDTSYRYRSIMGENTLTLIWESEEFIEIPVGASCEFEGQTYTLLKPENFKKQGTRKYNYTLTLDGAQGALRKYKMRDKVDKQLKFSLTAKPHEHLQLLIDNLNEREPGWTVGIYIDAPEKVISYNHTSLDAALQQIAEAFDTEWEIQGQTIHLRKVEYNKTNPLALSYGKGNGFLPGIGRANTGETNAIEILFVQGGERNINWSQYGSRELRLPKSASMTFNGRQYVTDALGMFVTRGDKQLTTSTEDSLDCSHIYPSRIGEVSAVEVINADNNKYDFFDSSIPEDLDFKACLIAGQSLTVKFETGILAGREFDVDYKHAERRFLLVAQEVDGVTMPNTTFQPSVGDKYAVFGMQMPDQYISNDATQTGASWDMFLEAVKYLYEHENPRFSFTGEMDGIWAKQNWLNVGGKIVLGGYVNFSDPNFQPSGISIRIVGIRDAVNNPYSPVIELSNAPAGVSVASELKKIKQNEVVVDDKVGDVYSYAKRRYRETIETVEMLQGAVSGFSEGVSPLSVQTMSLIVGSEALQFRFVDSKTTPSQVLHEVTFDGSNKIMSAPGGIIQHMTIGITTLQSGGREVDEYSFWDVTAFDSPPLTDPAKKYYLYIKASKADSTATFYLSESPIKMEEVSGYYHFLLGFLNSETDGERSFARMHGFTEVLPGRVTTSKIHADTVEATKVLAEEIYASGAKIGGLDISPDDLIADLDGIRLGNTKRFGPYSGEDGILLGVDESGETPLYKAFIGNSQSFIQYDGFEVVVSQNAKIVGGTTFKAIGDLGQYLSIGEDDNGNKYLYSELPVASAGNIVAFSADAYVSSIWEQMPKASATVYGGVKIGAGINVSNGVISLDTASLSPQVLALSEDNILSLDGGGGSVDLSTITPDLTGYATESWVGNNYLGKTAKAADADKLDGITSGLFLRSDVDGIVNGYIEFNKGINVPNANGSANAIHLPTSNFISVFGSGLTLYPNRAAGTFKIRSHASDTDYRTDLEIDARGNIGIGTSNPLWKLHVLNTTGGDGTYNGGILIENSGSSDGEPNLGFRTTSMGSNYWFVGPNQDSDINFAYGNSHTDSNTKVTITPSARVGIGTTSPAEALDVNGNIKASGDDNRFSFFRLLNRSDYNAFYFDATNSNHYLIAYKGTHSESGNLALKNNVAGGSIDLYHTSGKIHSFSNNGYYLKSAADAGITIEADSGNSDETANPYLYFKQDGGAVKASIGLSASSSADAKGSSISGAINSSNNYVFHNEYNSNIIFAINGSAKLQITSSGNLVSSSNVTAYSDARVKQILNDSTISLNDIRKVKTYDYLRIDKNDGRRYTGPVAQEIKRLFPQFVFGEETEDSMLSIAYGEMATTIAVRGIQDLAFKQDKHESRIEVLERTVHEQKQEIELLRSQLN